ncbi:hypothetical protein Caci_8546 [Catenulispora acidiphila DSM 44928]|uniref:DUF4236 domain-containing protein n=1 Tax=Catenulispora acidiphila (strain DSM 44928 / JCM 14897 / NBRC 102108 / NRRL B-24433 / ID139908) TaxID=479433 RepID=C7PYP4_CATAD|nr:DUF4236 domain-containing protein [Catenulispora acidiphila]ACU77366.1 hypothetical protein Caci_8546 [Catenulispora acidiphila DSM 44928]
MGFRYRKTFKAGPIRVTASKSGISYSAGVKGARVTKRADGRVQTTLSAPGTGLSYTKSSSSTKKPTRASSVKAAKPTATPTKSQAAKRRMPTRSELEQAWRATGRPLPAHGTRISERKATFLAGFMGLIARPDEETYFFLNISKLNPARDVLVLTSQRLLMFQANQVLRNSKILAVDLSSLRAVTIRRRPWSASLVLHDFEGTDQIVCGTVSPKALVWLRETTKHDPLFVLPD